jgi:hypothetical protein
MANPPERSGPGQSGAAAGASYFTEQIPGAMPYPVDSLPQGSRSTMADEKAVVRPESTPDDRLREMVVAALRDDGSGLDVTVAAGVVTLAGSVDDDVVRHRIEDRARRVPGVKAIHNELGVG